MSVVSSRIGMIYFLELNKIVSSLVSTNTQGQAKSILCSHAWFIISPKIYVMACYVITKIQQKKGSETEDNLLELNFTLRPPQKTGTPSISVPEWADTS